MSQALLGVNSLVHFQGDAPGDGVDGKLSHSPSWGGEGDGEKSRNFCEDEACFGDGEKSIAGREGRESCDDVHCGLGRVG